MDQGQGDAAAGGEPSPSPSANPNQQSAKRHTKLHAQSMLWSDPGHLVSRRRQELNGSDSGGLRVQLDGRREDEVGCSLSDSHAAGAQRPELTSPRLLILSHGSGWFVVGR